MYSRWSVSRWLAGLVLLAAVASLLFVFYGRPKPWNVLIVTFDTTRADRIGSYGNPRIDTPTLSRLAAEGHQFANAYSAVPITAPSHSTIMTGLYPIAHGVRDNGLFVLGDDQTTLAELLRERGYATAAAIGAYPVSSQFGLDQGFDFFDDHLTGLFEDYLGRRTPKKRLFFDERRAAQVNEAVMPWLTDNADKPFFAWVHYFDPHQPFEPPPPYDQLYADDLYNGEIAYTDAQLGKLLAHLERLGVMDRTLIVMAADHGEGLGEHNEVTHAVLAYDSTLHVPLIIRMPEDANPGKRVEQRVGLVDILPTVLDLLDIERPDHLQGRSLVPLMRGGDVAAPQYYAENLSPHLTHGWGKLRILYEGDYKYIHGPRPELFDLAADPAELDDLAASQGEHAARMREQLNLFLFDHTIGVSTVHTIDDETTRRLQSLGYLHGTPEGGQTVSEALEEGGVAPQDRVSDLNDMSSAKHLLYDGEYSRALVFTSRLIARSPDSPVYNELHISALAGTGRLEEAWTLLERGQGGATANEPLVLTLIAKRFEAGAQEAALEFLERYSQDTESARAHWLLASLYERRMQPQPAFEQLQQALAIDQGFVPARVDLAVHYARAGDPERAESEFLRALADGPYEIKAWYNYGAFLLNQGRLDAAGPYLQRTVDLAPGYGKGYVALVAAAVMVGDREAADGWLVKLRSAAPGSDEEREAVALLAGLEH